MKYVYLVLGKQNAEAYNYWITAVYGSQKRALELAKRLNEDQQRFGFHYVIKEPVE